MGYDISATTARTLDKRRQDGELCQGTGRSCTTRATIVVTQLTWTHKIGEGASRPSELVMCRKHAGQFQVGYKGVNFEVVDISPRRTCACGTPSRASYHLGGAIGRGDARTGTETEELSLYACEEHATRATVTAGLRVRDRLDPAGLASFGPWRVIEFSRRKINR